MVGFIWKKIVKERVLFEIKSRGGGALYGIEERGRGFWQSCHPPPPSSTGNRGVGNGGGGGRFRRPGLRGGRGVRGKRRGGVGA